MHIPKTAGTSLTTALLNAIRPARPVFGFDPVLFGDFRDFASLCPALRGQLHLSSHALPSDTDLAAGHIGYATLKRSMPTARMMTVLREPVSRIISHWLYWRGLGDEALSPWGDAWGGRVKLSRLPLAEFLASPSIACQTDNLAIRMLLWPDPRVPGDGFIDAGDDLRLLETARQRLGEFAFIDIVENPGLAARLATWLRRPLAIERHNETARLPAARCCDLAAELTTGAFDLLTQRSRLDLALWQSVAQRRSVPDPGQLRPLVIARNMARFATLTTPNPA